MSDWEIRIPYRDRSDPLTDVVDAARELPTDEERAVVRQLVLGELRPARRPLPAKSWTVAG